MNSLNEELKGKSGIYVIRNLVNNKAYIGSTVDLHIRKAKHFMTNGINKTHNDYLNRSFSKYGKNNFVFEVLAFVEDKESLLHIESLYIQLFNTQDKNIGYNMCVSGRSQLGNKHSEETKNKISMAVKGEKHPNYGKKLSEETKQKMSEYRKNKKHSEETKQKIGKSASIPIIQLTKNGEFVAEYTNTREAFKQTGIHYTNITKVCRGKSNNKTAGSFKWMYSEDYYKKEMQEG